MTDRAVCDPADEPRAPFTVPPYPYDRLAPLVDLAARHDGGCVDLSVGTPGDPPPTVVRDAMAASTRLAAYPPSVGLPETRLAAARWLERRLGVSVGEDDLALCIGTKELVAGLPQWLRLRDPSRDTVLYPEVSYPTYAMGARLAGCRAVPVPVDDSWRLDLDAVDPGDAARAVCLWVDSPGNPTGTLEDLPAVARWGRSHTVPVLSDECYVEFTWDHQDGAGPVPPRPGVVPGRTILTEGLEGVLAVHSLSKRSNLAGARIGFYCGDPDLVHHVSEIRKHAGFMVPGPVQDAAVAAWDDDLHVDAQRDRYWRRLERVRRILDQLGVYAPMPGGAFYLWARAEDGDAWKLAERLATTVGMLVSPGEFYGDRSADHIRVAVVRPDDHYDLLERRLG